MKTLSIIQLKSEVELFNFDDHSENDSYLVTYLGKNWKVRKNVHSVLLHLRSAENFELMLENLAKKEILVSQEELDVIVSFLKKNGLIVGYEPEASKNKPLRNKMLWLRLTILPSKMTKKFEFLAFLFDKLFFIPTAVIFLIWFTSIYLTNSPSLIGEQLITLSFIELIMCYIFLVFTGFIHEIGHAVALIKYDEKPGRIGLGVYFVMPVLFTDVTRVWRLSRMKRTMVDLGGIYFQGLILLISFTLNELFIQNHLLFLGMMLSTLTIMGNFNPFIKLDGYWIFSDILGVDDLHKLVKDILLCFLNNNRLQNPLNKFKKNQKVILIVYTLATCLFFSYLVMMIFRSLVLGVQMVHSDLIVLFSERFYHWNLQMNDLFSYLSSRFTIFLVFFFAIRMIYMSFKKGLRFIKVKKVNR